jgi:hypothetical protein
LRLVALLFLIPFFAFAQSSKGGKKFDAFDWGFRAGTHNTQTSVSNANNRVRSSEPQAGYHFGTYARFNFRFFYIEPEFQFAGSRGELEFTTNANNPEYRSFNFNRFDVPIQIGQKLGPLRVYGGINLNFNRSEGLSTIISTGMRDETRAWRAGLGLDAGNWSMDVRYETSMGTNVDGVLFNGEPVAAKLRFTHIYLSLGYTIL